MERAGKPIDYSAYSYVKYHNGKAKKERANLYNGRKGQYKYSDKDEGESLFIDREESSILVNRTTTAKTQDVAVEVFTEHKIEDFRTEKQEENTCHRDSSSESDCSTAHGIKVVVGSIVLTFMCLYAVLVFFVGSDVLPVLAPSVSTGSVTYYALDCGSYVDIDSAKYAADSFRKQGGAGFVLRAEEYHVLLSVYSSESDCATVVSRLSQQGIDSSIYKMYVYEADLRRYSTESAQFFQNTLKYYEIIYSKLYELSNNYSKETIGDFEAILEIKLLRNQIQAMSDEFKAAIPLSEQDLSYIATVATLTGAVTVLDNLCADDDSDVLFLSHIRYSYVYVINDYISLVTTINSNSQGDIAM